MSEGEGEMPEAPVPPEAKFTEAQLTEIRQILVTDASNGGDRFTHKLTDVGNAEKFAEIFGAEFRYVTDWKKWIAWDGRRWADGTTRVKRAAVETVRELLGDAYKMKTAAEGIEDDVARSAALKVANRAIAHAIESQSAARIAAILAIAISAPGLAVTAAALDSHPFLLNVRNGTIDLRTGELSKHQRAHLITRVVLVDYDPKAKCPEWDHFLETTNPSVAQRTYIQRTIGYALTGSIEEHALFYHYGDGGRGKSTFLNTIHELLGDYAARAARKMLFVSRNERHPTELTVLHGARFVTCSEIEDGRTFDEALVKDLTGGDPISARRMGEDFWSFMPTHKFFLAGNYKAKVKGEDEGIWRRMRLIPWTVAIPKKDKKLPKKLREEMRGILAWAVRGAIAWCKEGLNEPREVSLATEEYRHESDRLGEFFDLRCAFDPDARVARKALRAAYESYLQENGFDHPLGPKEFASKLAVRGVVDGGTLRDKQTNKVLDAWRGIRLLSETERGQRGAPPYKTSP